MLLWLWYLPGDEVRYYMGLSYESVMGAAKISFCWNSNDGSLEQFQKDLADLLIDYQEDQILNMARRVDNATDNNERINITSNIPTT